MIYKHIQKGYLMWCILVIMMILFGSILLKAEILWSAVIIMTLVIIILASFSTLKVEIYEQNLFVTFGYGIYKKKFNINEINSCKEVKNHWYYGWGIRYWWKPSMWIYNVSGFKAVEITLKNGEIYRIGTDEPNKLNQVILTLIK